MPEEEKSECLPQAYACGEPDYELKSMEDLCSSTWEPLYRFIYFRVQNREEAEDITQETYIKAFEHFRKNRIRIEKKLGFLMAVSLNVLRDRWRLKKRKGTDINLDDIDPGDAALEDATESGAQRALIKDALNRLSEAERTVVDLRIIKGYSAAEAARIMQKTEGAIRVLQHRALKNLAGLLHDELP